jgi:hypothetical protein
MAGVAFLDAAIAAGLAFAAGLAALSDLLSRETLPFGSSILLGIPPSRAFHAEPDGAGIAHSAAGDLMQVKHVFPRP